MTRTMLSLLITVGRWGFKMGSIICGSEQGPDLDAEHF